MKKTLALLLSLALAFSSMAVGVFAEDEGTPAADPNGIVLDNTGVDQDAVVEGEDAAQPEAPVEAGEPAQGTDEPSVNADDPAPDADAVPQDEEEDVAKNSLLDDSVTENDFTVKADPTSSTSATISWSWTEGIEVTSVQVEGYDPITITGTEPKNTVINSLKPGTTQTFKVIFTYKDGDKEKTTDKQVSVTLPTNAITDLKSYSAYKSIALEWSPVAGATSYNIYRGDKNGNNFKIIQRDVTSKAYRDSRFMGYIDKNGDESNNVYSYRVTANSSAGESAVSNTVKDSSVTQLYITVTFKKTRKLKSHDKAHKKMTFKKGTKVQCHSFKFGKYIFNYKGHLYYCNYMSLKKFKANLNKKLHYSNEEAEYFAYTSGRKSNTSYMIWANLYTQQLYVLKNKNGVWKMADDLGANNWIVSSGKADSPSPAGMDFKLLRHKKTQRGVKWLTFYHSQTSLHGKVGNQNFNTLRSGGCIRNPDKYAKLIYKKIPLKTRLIVY